MATPIYYPPSVNNLQKEINADYTAGASTVTLNNTTNIQNKPGVCVVNRVNSAGTRQAVANWTYLKFTGTSGNTLTGVTAISGDQDHGIGEVVEFVPDVTWAEQVAGGFATLLDATDVSKVNTTNVITPDGTQTLTNKTLTSPTITSPTISGTLALSQSWDGWIAATDTWTYASATTFTIAGVDRTALFPKGTKIKLTQTTTKYFYVVASSFSTNTTITVTGGSDYSLSSASITSPFYSYVSCPQGFPTVFSYTPVLSVNNGGTVAAFTTNVGTFSINGGLVEFKTDFAGDGGTDGVGSTAAIFITSPTPIETTKTSTNQILGQVAWYGTGTTEGAGLCQVSSSTVIALRKTVTNPLYADTFPNGSRYLYVSGTYRL